MRQFLDKFYWSCSVIASIFIVLICIIVLIQVVFNVIDKLAALITGMAIGFVLPSYAEFAGYLLAASMSFALADTLKSGSHIRVTLITQKMSARQFWFSEIFAHVVGLFLSIFFAYWAFHLVYDSFRFNDLSPGIVPVPIWIPQLSMALGVAALAVCFADQLVSTFVGRTENTSSNSSVE